MNLHLGIKFKYKVSIQLYSCNPTFNMEASQGPFYCPSCDGKWKRQRDLKAHILREHTEPNINCPQCDYKTALKSKMKYHFQSCHENVRYNCKFCDHELKNKSSLRVHIKVQHLNDTIFCNDCDFKTTSKEYMKLHVQGLHESVAYPCKFCDYVARRNQTLGDHIKSKHTEANIFCNLCNYRTSMKRNMKNHIQVTHESKTYKCDSCSFITRSTSTLRTHKRSKHGNLMQEEKNISYKDPGEENIFGCQYCSMSRFTWTGLMKHIKMMHQSMTDPTVLETLISDDENQRVQKDILEKPDDHEKLITTKLKKKIVINSEEVENIEELDAKIIEHMEKTVDGKWMCNICEKKMRHKVHVKEHVETHIEGLTFPCQQCSSVASSRHSLRSHIRRHNAKIKDI